MARNQATRQKHVPMRTCIGTGEKQAKRDMVRVVRREDGHIVVDPTGKVPGSRGAYLSKSSAAAERAFKRKAFEAEFGAPIPPEDIDAIRTYFSQF